MSEELRALRRYTYRRRFSWLRERIPRRLALQAIPGWRLDVPATNFVVALCGPYCGRFVVLSRIGAAE